MSRLYATVRCHCFDEGRLFAPPPHEDDLYIDEHGYPALGMPQISTTAEAHAQFAAWLRAACEHPDMHYTAVEIGTSGLLRALVAALALDGTAHYPTLLRWLPRAQSRALPATFAKAAQKELRYFQKYADFGLMPCLINTETGRTIQEYVPDSTNMLCTLDVRSGMKIGFDASGFQLIQVDAETGQNRVRFRAMQFKQHLLDPERGAESPAEYTNLANGHSAISPLPVNERRAYPRYLHIEQRRHDLAVFDPLIDVLLTALSAAEAVGNPLVIRRR